MNKIEKIVYDLVKKNPKLKFKIRNMYQSFFDLLPDKQNFFQDEVLSREGFFFGFHDVCPFSKDETKILANKLEIPLRMPLPTDSLTVGFWDIELLHYIKIGKSYAWNYHKGCRLQWLGENGEKVIYNNSDGKNVISTICTLSDMSINYLKYPIDTASPDGSIATSFSYERLEKFMPGYGYPYSDDAFLDEFAPADTGLFVIDLEKNTRKLIVSLQQIANIMQEKSMEGAYHYVTHTEFSPDGKRIAFLHRWTHDPSNRWTRLVTCDLDGNDIHISNTSGMVSHYNWSENGDIVAYCQVDGVDGHYLFEDYTLQSTRRVADCLNSDGHQAFVPNKDMFVTDTYPDKRRYSGIYLVDLEKDIVKKIVEVKSPKKYQSPDMYHHWACDLHPRVSPTGKFICFDSVFTGERALHVMEL